jgi:hypothetical protein
MAASPQRSPRDDVAKVDRRWFLTTAAAFVASLGGLTGAAAILRATGPHPWLGWIERRLRFYSNAMMRYRPRLNRKG